MPPKQSLGNMHLPIPLVGEVEGLVVTRDEDGNTVTRDVVCPAVAQQWVDRYPTASPLIAETTLGTCYHVMVVEFDMGRRPQWVFTTEVGQPHTYGRLLMPDPPVVPYLEWLDTCGRGPDSDSDGCDTERDIDT